MDVVAWIALGVVIVLMVVVKARNADRDYSMGKSIFKNSEHNIDKEKQQDASDFDYYNETDKLK